MSSCLLGGERETNEVQKKKKKKKNPNIRSISETLEVTERKTSPRHAEATRGSDVTLLAADVTLMSSTTDISAQICQRRDRWKTLFSLMLILSETGRRITGLSWEGNLTLAFTEELCVQH